MEERADKFQAYKDDSGNVRVRKNLPNGELHLTLNPDGVAIDVLDSSGEITDEGWRRYTDIAGDVKLPRGVDIEQ